MKLIVIETDNKIINAFNKIKGIKPIIVESVDQLYIENSSALNQAVIVCSKESIYQKVRSYSVFTPVLMYKLKKLDPLVVSFARYIDMEIKASEVLAKALYAKTHMTNEVNMRDDKLTRIFLKSHSLEQYLDHFFLHFSQILEVENIFWVSDLAIEVLRQDVKSLSSSNCYRHSPETQIRDLKASSLQELVKIVEGTDFLNDKSYYCYKIENCGLLAFKISSSWISSTYESVAGAMDSFFAPLLFQHFQIKQSYAKARIDNLTGLFNYRFLYETLNEWTQESSKNQFATLFIDLDYFKQVNDSHGHMVGSKTLVAFSKELFSFFGDQAVGIRYGGDEFVVLLENQALKPATELAEGFRQQIESKTFKVSGQELKFTVSIGVAVYPDHAKTPDKILEIADQAMYFGKQKSRNITYIAS